LPRASLDEPYGHPRDDRHVAAIRGAVDRYNDPSAAPLSEVAKSYLEEQERRSPSLPKSTVYKMKKALDAFAAYLLPLAGDPPLRQVTRRHAGGYVSELLKNGQAPATNKGRITMLGTFWKWSMLKGYTEATPWAGQVQTLRGSRRGNGSVRRRAFTPDELLALVNAAGPDDRRWHLVVLALYTGCRLEELASTETKDVDVDAGALYLPEGKTESSVRHVPIHSVIAPLVKHLVKASSDGYLLAGLKGRGMDKRRGSYIGDRTNEFIDQAVSDDPGLVVHSLRKNFARALDNAGIPSNIAESLVGHRRQSMTYDAYSGSPEFAVLRAAMANVTYGSEVDDAVRAALSEFDRAA
jgi:integrase